MKIEVEDVGVDAFAFADGGGVQSASGSVPVAGNRARGHAVLSLNLWYSDDERLILTFHHPYAKTGRFVIAAA